MNYKYLYLIDADQYCLKNIMTNDDLIDSYLIAASNDQEKLRIGHTYHGMKVPSLAESADAYLVSQFAVFLHQHQASEIIIATRDKKLMYMLLNICIGYRLKNVILHNCCKDQITFDLRDFSPCFKSRMTELDIEITHHLSAYPNGLKLKTLSLHYGLSQKRMNRIIDRLIQLRCIYKNYNTYHSYYN